jgi:hypothetical protein
MEYFFRDNQKAYIARSAYRSKIGAKLGENTEKLLEIDSVVIDIIHPV